MIRAADVIKKSDVLLFCTGAGMGVDSGLPDFRGTEGFWRAYPPMKKLKLELSEMSTPHWFESDPTFAWGFWAHRKKLYKETEPHEGYYILQRWAMLKQHAATPKGIERAYFSFTSNVDGHWQRILPANDIYEIHGTLTHLQCIKDCQSKIWKTPQKDIPFEETSFLANEQTIPKCSDCGAIARPNVLMFGDWSWNGKRTQRQEGEYLDWQNGLVKDVKVAVIEIGAGLGVPTVRLNSERIAAKYQGTLIRINKRDPQTITTRSGWLQSTTSHSPASISLPYAGLPALQKIENIITKNT